VKELYGLHIPFVVAFLAFALLLILAHTREDRR
jgi:hypothetical protein